MTKMNHRTDSVSDTPEHIIKNIQKLMEEVEAIVAKSSPDSPESALSSRIEDLQERFAGAKAKAQGYYKVARQKVVDGAHAADDTIR